MPPWGQSFAQSFDDQACSSCRGPLRFDPSSQYMACSRCGAQRPPGAGNVEANLPSKRCRKCGAHAAGDARALAGPCGFCGATMVAARAAKLNWPNAVIPFQLSRSDAQARLTAWLADMPSPPSGITKHADTGRQLKSLYLPFYRFTHRASDTETVTARSACPQLAQFLGKGDVLELAWRSLPFRPFHPDFIAGHLVTLPEMTMRDAIRAEAAHSAAATAHTSTPRTGQIRTPDWELEGCLRVLAPVWVGSYKWGNQRYAVAIDGASGKVLGARPQDGLDLVHGMNSATEWTFKILYVAAMGTIALFGVLAGVALLLGGTT